MKYVIAYDIGTTGVKTCLFEIGETIKQLASANAGYKLYTMDDGGAEQDCEEWWSAMCITTREVFGHTTIRPSQVEGISFCSQMQGFVAVDKEGRALRRPMSYMDQRARKEIAAGLAHGLQIAGANIFKLITCLTITGAVPSSVKDPVWKYKWVENHEPEVFKKLYKWLDVKEYFILRCTGEFVMTEDSAYATLIYDTRKGKRGWSKKLCRMFGVNMDHLPKVVKCTDKVGNLTTRAADELGLSMGIPVFGGGGDATLIGVGSGCVHVGDTHIYSGTSGWVSTITDRQIVDTNYMIAAIVGAFPDKYNYFAEMETAGKCLEWVKNHLALDEIGVYLDKRDITTYTDREKVYTSLYEYMTETVKDVPPGAGGVLFTPWLHGNRCPFEDPSATGMFFGITMHTGKTELIRAVLEGICYHLRWMLECQDKKITTSETIRFSGGGALSGVSAQILSDMTGRVIEIVDHPQDVGAVGAAALMAVGLGVLDDLGEVDKLIPAALVYRPDLEKKKIYDKYYNIFIKLHSSNRRLYSELGKMRLSDVV